MTTASTLLAVGALPCAHWASGRPFMCLVDGLEAVLDVFAGGAAAPGRRHGSNAAPRLAPWIGPLMPHWQCWRLFCIVATLWAANGKACLEQGPLLFLAALCAAWAAASLRWVG